jgi:hypothetical protein
MVPAPDPLHRVALAWAAVALGCAVALTPLALQAQPASHPAPRSALEQGPHWQELTPAQQGTLRPLQHEWVGIAADQKQKWIELSTRVPRMTPPEQTRVQERMAEWARLTPQQRGQARLNFEEAKRLPREDRQARWAAYQALTPEQRQQLAARAHPASDAAHRAPAAHTEHTAHDVALTKSNIVPNPALAAAPTTAAPTLVQARPGATTTLVTKRATPPTHEQSGLPKIAATPEFVNKSTLLPHRGPQGSATRSAAAPQPGAASTQ